MRDFIRESRRFLLALIAILAFAALPAAAQEIVSQKANSLNFVTLFNAVAATAAQTSAATRIPVFSGYGILSIVGAGITGAPAGCQIALNYQQSINATNSAVTQTVTFTPANSYLTSQITPAVTLASGDMMVAVYTCTTFPTAGTLSVVFDPFGAMAITNTPNINLSQVAGNTALTGTGASGAGVLRVTVSNDSSLAANQSVNVAQIAGTATATAAAGVQKVGIVGNANAAVDAAIGAAPPANAIYLAGKDIAGNAQAFIIDPCQSAANTTRTSTNINQTAGAQLITGTAAKQTYICSLNLITATAQNIALVEGTGTVCATGIAGMAGGSTAATGWNFAANGGLVSNGTGFWVFKTATAADNVCLLQSGTGQVSGNLTSVQQ